MHPKSIVNNKNRKIEFDKNRNHTPLNSNVLIFFWYVLIVLQPFIWRLRQFNFHVLVLTENATFDCRENGTWYVNPATGREYADYSACFNFENAIKVGDGR